MKGQVLSKTTLPLVDLEKRKKYKTKQMKIKRKRTEKGKFSKFYQGTIYCILSISKLK